MTDPQMPQDALEMFRRLWGPLGVPVPGLAMPTLDPAEIDKRIAELRSVEGWLSMNLNMLRMAIQGLEVQKAALQAVRATADAGREAAAVAAQQPMVWPWSAMQQALGQMPTPPTPDPHRKEEKKT